jgi:hypothetical protein
MTIDYGALAKACPPADLLDVPESVDERTDAENQRDQWENEQLEFEQGFGGPEEFLALMWSDPSEYRLVTFGHQVSVHDPHSSVVANPEADLTPDQLARGLRDGQFGPRCVDAEKLAEFVRSVELDAWLGSYWEWILRFNGIAALELAEKVHEIEKHRAANPIRGKFIDPDAESIEPQWLVEDVLPAGVLHAAVGRNQAGKSFAIAIDLACSVATGTPWLGHAVRPGRVLVIVAEDTQSDYLARLDAWRRAHPKAGDPLDSMRVALHRPRLVAPPEEYTVTDADGNENSFQRRATGRSADVRALCEIIAEDRPTLVIIDNLAACMDGHSDMSSADVGSVLSAMKSLSDAAGSTVMMVAHTDYQDRKPRGLSMFEDRMNVVLHLKAHGDERQVIFYKARSMARPKPIKWRLVPSGESVVPQVADAGGSVELIYAVLKELGGLQSKNAIYEKAREIGKARSTPVGKKQTFLQTIDELADDPDESVERRGGKFGLIGMDEDGE